MKKRVLSLFAIVLSCSISFGQEKSNQTGFPDNYPKFNQIGLLNNYPEGNITFKKFFAPDRLGKKMIWQTPLLAKAQGQDLPPVTIYARESNTVSIEFGRSWYGLTINDPEFPTFYEHDGRDMAMIIIDDFVYVLDDFDLRHKENDFRIVLLAVNGDDKKAVSSKLYADHITIVKDYFKAVEEAKVEYDAKLRKQYSIENKAVSSIEIVDLEIPEKFGRSSFFSFSVQANLADGNKILAGQNDEIGYLDDYIIDINGVDGGVKGTQGKEGEDNYKKGYYLKEGKGRYDGFMGDELVITVKSRFNPTLIATERVVVPHTASFGYLKWPGMDCRVEITQIKHSITNNALLHYKIIPLGKSGTRPWEYKLVPDAHLHLSTDGSEYSSGQDGGDIFLVVDENVEDYYFTYSTKGSKGKNYDNDGRRGIFRKEVKNLSE